MKFDDHPVLVRLLFVFGILSAGAVLYLIATGRAGDMGGRLIAVGLGLVSASCFAISSRHQRHL